MATPVTDPDLLAQLNAGPKPVTDPDLLKQLDAPAPGAVGSAENPDASGPAITWGQEQFSPGLPAVNAAANAASESVGKAASNLPASGARFVGNIANAAMHPIDTASDLGALAAGVAQYAGVPGESYKPYADAAGRAIMNRYGSLSAAKKTFEDDPIGFAADVSSVLGGVGLARNALGIGRTGATAARAAAPSVEELFDSADGHYNAMNGFGVELHPHVGENIANSIETELHSIGYRDYLTPKTFRAVDELRNPTMGASMPTSDIEGVRRALNKAAGDPAERDAARRAIATIDAGMAVITPADAAVNGHFAPRVSMEARMARGDYAAAKRAEQIEAATSNAELQAASTGSGANIDNATRQKIRAILTNPKRRRGFSEDELAQMQGLVRGTFTGNAARLLGKLAPTGVVSAGLSTALGEAMGHAVGVPVLGLAAKAIGDQATRRAAARLSEQVRLRSPLARQIGASAAPPLLPRAASAVARNSRNANLLGRLENP